MTALDEKINIISKDSIPYEWLHNDSFENLDTFKKFNNWLSGEFTLYLQDERDGLTVFFPNGSFSIIELEPNSASICFNIEVKSKCFKSGTKIFNQVKSILIHLKHFKN